MHNPFDQLAKKVGKEALDASGPTIVQYEISRDAQHADLRHDPDPARGAERARLGLLGRIAEILERLERWLERAILATSVSEVIDEPT